MRECPRCTTAQQIEERKTKTAAIISGIPQEYENLRLETVKGDIKRHPDQPERLAEIQANPDASYLITGKNDCGKTMIGWLLYRRAIEACRPAVCLPVSLLLLELRMWENGGREPSVTPHALRQKAERFTIVLDEMEKAKPTEFAGNVLFLIIDMAYSFQHQLVILSNWKVDALTEHWERALPGEGISIMDRIRRMKNRGLIEMF